MRTNITPFIISILGISIFVFAVYIFVNAVVDCSWADWLLYGRNLGWAWMTGYCNG